MIIQGSHQEPGFFGLDGHGAGPFNKTSCFGLALSEKDEVRIVFGQGPTRNEFRIRLVDELVTPGPVLIDFLQQILHAGQSHTADQFVRMDPGILLLGEKEETGDLRSRRWIGPPLADNRTTRWMKRKALAQPFDFGDCRRQLELKFFAHAVKRPRGLEFHPQDPFFIRFIKINRIDSQDLGRLAVHAQTYRPVRSPDAQRQTHQKTNMAQRIIPEQVARRGVDIGGIPGPFDDLAVGRRHNGLTQSHFHFFFQNGCFQLQRFPLLNRQQQLRHRLGVLLLHSQHGFVFSPQRGQPASFGCQVRVQIPVDDGGNPLPSLETKGPS